ncbi:ATP-grasp domain-containing protein [Solwaraspora sp. WMMB335]|uniref:ATP-grasp domain-containing protein n=1 Tax=Solwaraspora sp. WMMB335 TaxID=3404118 RepID=UPI003B9522EB
MRILVLHSLSDSFAGYSANIDHFQHEVTYVGTADRLTTVPHSVPLRAIERSGSGDTAQEVLSAVAGRPAPDVVLALSEFDLIPAAHIRESLGVPGPTVREVLPSRDKVVMKSAVAAAGVRVPRFMSLASAVRCGASSLPWTGSTVVKPVAGASSAGVVTFPSPGTALEAVSEAGSSGQVEDWEIEEFVDGRVLHIDGLMAGGTLAVIQASRYVGTCLGYAYGAPLGSIQTETGGALADWSLSCLKAVGIIDGPFHLEAIESSDGLVFLEVAARCGSGGTMDTFELATGVRLPGAAIRLAVEGASALPPPRLPEAEERFGWFTFPGHTLGTPYCRISGLDEFRDGPLIRRWVERRNAKPLRPTISYAFAHVPLGGLIGPGSTESLERYLTDLFESVRVLPHGPSAE